MTKKSKFWFARARGQSLRVINHPSYSHITLMVLGGYKYKPSQVQISSLGEGVFIYKNNKNKER